MSKLYRIRQTVQVLSFILFICFLVYLDPLTEQGKTVNFFVRLSPLSAIGAMIAARELIINFWPALIVLISTIILGRYFCSWVCPFGTTIDITDKFFSKKREKENGNLTTSLDASKSPGNPLSPSRIILTKADKLPRFHLYDKRRLKYYILIFLLISFIFGIQMVGWFDPLSLATNTYTILVHPYIVTVIDTFFHLFYGIPFVEIVMKPIHEVFKTVLFSFHPPFFRSHIIFLLIFICIISFGLVYRRYWCRNLCPLGALLALASDWALFKRVVSNNCTSCRRCEIECGMGAIKDDGKVTMEGECTLCLRCQGVCPGNAINFTRKQDVKQSSAIDLSKRKVLAAGFFSLASIPILRLSFFGATDKNNPLLIRPPGASIESKFIAKCLRCGECMRVCKTNGLHPVVFESALSDVWTPTLVPRLGYCDYECTLCGKVCPSGAIKKLDKEEKQMVVIGKAVIDHNRCIPWVGFSSLPALKSEWKDVNCGVCEEVCPIPIKAIRFDPYIVGNDKEIRRVYVDEDVCTGCGFCEKVCPVTGEAAIKVEGVQPQIISKKLKELKSVPSSPSVIKYFPESIGTWKRESAPAIYIGSGKLFQYINGGADSYLSYSFVQVAVANYRIVNTEKSIKGKSIKIDIWEFKNSDDAYGVFSKERAGNMIDIGNEGAIYDNYLWIWYGLYYIRIEPQDGYRDITAKEVTILGNSVVSGMPESSNKPPTIVNLMPLQGLDPSSIKFFHDKIVIDNIYISNQFIEENVFILGKNTDAVIGEYKVNEDVPPLKLMIIKYPDVNTAKKAFQNLVNLKREEGKELESSIDTLRTYVDSANQFYSICHKDDFLISTFLAPSSLYSEKYINAVLEVFKK
ncbi:MAG: DUF6599 family protein [Candidatus Anammoxibacter sp.]